MLGMDGQSLIVYHYISMLCIVVEKYFGIIKENSLIINLSNFLHRKITHDQQQLRNISIDYRSAYYERFSFGHMAQ